jgi:hypothetical protein
MFSYCWNVIHLCARLLCVKGVTAVLFSWKKEVWLVSFLGPPHCDTIISCFWSCALISDYCWMNSGTQDTLYCIALSPWNEKPKFEVLTWFMLSRIMSLFSLVIYARLYWHTSAFRFYCLCFCIGYCVETYAVNSYTKLTQFTEGKRWRIIAIH